jgi:hypothetical protein
LGDGSSTQDDPSYVDTAAELLQQWHKSTRSHWVKLKPNLSLWKKLHKGNSLKQETARSLLIAMWAVMEWNFYKKQQTSFEVSMHFQIAEL